MLYIREKDNNIVFESAAKNLCSDDVLMIKEALEQDEKNGVLNMDGILEVKTTTLGTLKKVAQENKLSLCALDADIFAVINLLNYDKDFQIYPTEQNSFEDKYEMKNRQFKVV